MRIQNLIQIQNQIEIQIQIHIYGKLGRVGAEEKGKPVAQEAQYLGIALWIKLSKQRCGSKAKTAKLRQQS